MEVHQDLERILEPDENGIAVFTGRELRNIQDHSMGNFKPYANNRGHPLPEIINELGELSSKVIPISIYRNNNNYIIYNIFKTLKT
jgi:hypothetical protein